jgi:hypothetical protein
MNGFKRLEPLPVVKRRISDGIDFRQWLPLNIADKDN